MHVWLKGSVPPPRFLALVSVGTFAVMSASCGKPDSASAKEADRSSTTRGDADTNSGVNLTPAQVVQRLHEFRVAGDSAGVEAQIVPEHRSAARALMAAADRLIAAEAELRATVTRKLGHAAALRVDRAGVCDAAGVFSLHLRTIDERIERDSATVTIQIADRVPLERVAMVRRDGRWLIELEKPAVDVVEPMEALAEVLRAVARRVDRGDVTDATLTAELAAQQAPALRRLRTLLADPGP